MRNGTIELTEEQYFFLKEKALELQKHNQNASIVSIIPDLVEKNRQEWPRGKSQTSGSSAQAPRERREGEKPDDHQQQTT